MAIHTPPSWLQNASHPAENDRLTTQALWATTGIISPTSLAVTANSPVGMSVIVASGWGAVVGTIQANMGTYVAFNDGNVTLTVTAANPSLPRIDLVCLTVNDSYYAGATDNVVIQIIAGTPNASPVAPTLPANSLALARVAVAAAALSITSGDITDMRQIVTTNFPIGDITEVVAGTGLTGGGTSGAVTLAIDSTVATLTGTQTFTNKTLTAPTINGATIGTSTLTAPKVNLGVNPLGSGVTTYTTVADDNGSLITTASTSAVTITIAPSIYAQGAQINVSQFAAGQVGFAAGSGVTIVSTGATAATPKTRATYSSMTAVHIGSDTWVVMGDIV